MLKNKVVVLGVSGGIAAYKTAELISGLKKLNADVHVVMTESACEFITPLTMRTLSQNHVVYDMFKEPPTWEIEHISLAKKADIIVIAPATANILGKVASGIADDILTTTVMAAKCPVIFAPSMNTNMYENCIVQRNIETLKSYGYRFIEPETGRLACGDAGKGRLADIEDIIEEIIYTIAYQKDLEGKTVLVTAGPTLEEIDPVRYITNHSTGKMGYEIARAAKHRGATVILIKGPINKKPINGIKEIEISSAAQMYSAVIENSKNTDIIIKAAAVSDYRPVKVSKDKIKKKSENTSMELTKNPDILFELGKRKGPEQVLIGFSMETENIDEYASKKVFEKDLDFIVANDVTQEGAGFGGDTNIVKLLFRDGKVETIPCMSKYMLGHEIINRAIRVLETKIK
jgi:phosphopantothenoylcysteine decarboxylase/phosphopantothenate--cysteine ligase